MHATSEIRQEVTSILAEWGATILSVAKDGNTHQCVRFIFRDKSFKFHFPSTPQMNGRGRKNVHARLKRILRAELPEGSIMVNGVVATRVPRQRIAAPRPVLHMKQTQSMGEPKPSPRHDTRDIEIWQAIKQGESAKLLSMLHNITEHRVIQIFHQMNKEKHSLCS